MNAPPHPTIRSRNVRANMPSLQIPRNNRPANRSGYMGAHTDPTAVNFILEPLNCRQRFNPPQSNDAFRKIRGNRHQTFSRSPPREMYQSHNSNIIDPNDVYYQEFQRISGRPGSCDNSYFMNKLAQKYKIDAYNLSHTIPPPFPTRKPYTVAPVSASCPFPAPQPQVYRSSVLPKKGPGVKGGLTKNAFVTCVCGDRIQFSLNVENNQNNSKSQCEICFERLRKDFEELVESYIDQGFIPCKCRGRISVSELAAEYWQAEGLRCICDDPSKMVHTCGKPARPQRRFAAKSFAADFARDMEEDRKQREEDEAIEEECYSDCDVSVAKSEEYDDDDYDQEESGDFAEENKSSGSKKKAAKFPEDEDDFNEDDALPASEAPSDESVASQATGTSVSKSQKRSVTSDEFEDDFDADASTAGSGRGTKGGTRYGGRGSSPSEGSEGYASGSRGGGRTRSEYSEDYPRDSRGRCTVCGDSRDRGGRGYPSSRSGDSDGYQRGGRGGRYESPGRAGRSSGYSGGSRDRGQTGPLERGYRGGPGDSGRARDRQGRDGGRGKRGGAGAYPDEERRGGYRDSRGSGRQSKDDSRGSDISGRSSRGSGPYRSGERPRSGQTRDGYGGERRPGRRTPELYDYSEGRGAKDYPTDRGGYEPQSDRYRSRGSRRDPDYSDRQWESSRGRVMRPEDRDMRPKGRRSGSGRDARDKERRPPRDYNDGDEDKRRRPVGGGAGFQSQTQDRKERIPNDDVARSRKPASGAKRAEAGGSEAAKRGRPRAREPGEKKTEGGGARPKSERKKYPEGVTDPKPRVGKAEGEQPSSNKSDGPPREKRVTEKTVTKRTTVERAVPEEKEKPVKKKRPAEGRKKAVIAEKTVELAKEEAENKPVSKDSRKKNGAPATGEKVQEPAKKEEELRKENVEDKKVVKKKLNPDEVEKVVEKKEVKKRPKEEPAKVVKTEEKRKEVTKEEKKENNKLVQKETTVKEETVVEEEEKPKKPKRHSRSDMGSHHVTY